MDPVIRKRASGKRPKKRKYYGHRGTKSSEIVKPKAEAKSSSARKLSGIDKPAANSSLFMGYRLIDIELLFKAIENSLSCKICHGQVTLKEVSVCGLSSKFSIVCKVCEAVNFRSTKLIGRKTNIPEVNRRAVLGMRAIGKGLAALETFCNVMCLPSPVTQKAYDAINKHIAVAASTVARSSMVTAAVEEVGQNDANSDITVSGDGTWKTRGHSSLIGVCSVIGANTGKVIDLHVMSSYCKGCESYKGKKCGPRYHKWKKNHDKECKKNHYGSASKMEVDGMLQIFSRSVSERGVRYANYIGDGDTKTYTTLKNADLYDGLPVQKIECVGHVQKRMGTRLRKLKTQMQKQKLSDGKTIGGKGRLTEALISKLTTLYGNAIRGNKYDLKCMRQAVWAVWAHTASSDDEPMHYFCPKGKNTWCGFNRAAFEKKEFKHSSTVPKPVMLCIKPIFKDLCDPGLLKRCLGGKTQNSNESFNSVIWKYCSKVVGSGKHVADIAASMAAITFNDGNKGIMEVMNKLDLLYSKITVANFDRKDKKRIETADNRITAATYEARKSRKRQKILQAESQRIKEGEMYAAGSF